MTANNSSNQRIQRNLASLKASLIDYAGAENAKVFIASNAAFIRALAEIGMSGFFRYNDSMTTKHMGETLCCVMLRDEAEAFLRQYSAQFNSLVNTLGVNRLIMDDEAEEAYNKHMDDCYSYGYDA